MLGRLELSISTCISRFSTLIEQVSDTPSTSYSRDDRNRVGTPVERAHHDEQTMHNVCTTVLQGCALKSELFEVTSAVSCKV